MLAVGACQPRLSAEPSSAEPKGAAAAEVSLPTTGYDARLTNYPYPFEVLTFATKIQGREHTMAYMDVSPELDVAPKSTVVLFHGKNFSGAHWEQTARALVQSGYRVLMPDQLGFGKSSKPTDIQYSFHLLAHLSKRLLDHLGVQDASVVGHAMGGMLATRFALMHPEFTRQLVLLNPIGLEDYAHKVPYATIDEQAHAALQATPESLRQYMSTNYFDGRWKPEYDEVVALQAGWAVGPDKEHLALVSALTADMIYTQPVVHEFPRVKTPTLLVIGQRDRTALGKNLVPQEVAKTMGLYPQLGRAVAAAIPNAKLVPLESVGHLPHYEAFDIWIRTLTSFLSSGQGSVGK